MMPAVRTTVTLDADVAQRLREVCHARGISFKEALNSSVRSGLSRHGESPQHPYRIPSRDMGVRTGVDLDHALGLAAELEDIETLRKIDVRK